MEKVKKNILLQQVQKIDEVLTALKQNFDINEEIADGYTTCHTVHTIRC